MNRKFRDTLKIIAQYAPLIHSRVEVNLKRLTWVDKGKVIITPVAIIPKDELWAWSPKIRSAIENGRDEAKKGKLNEYSSVEELWSDLHVAETED